MSMKEKMADMMMGNMSSDEKQAMMSSMMDKFVSGLTATERQEMMSSMMEKFMGSMTGDEKQGMMQTMMPKMMSGMMGGGGMMGMMSAMMGRSGSEKKAGEAGEEPMDMCKKMMATMTKTSELATFATPEVRGLFEEWAAQIEDEILSFASTGSIDAKAIAAHFKLSVESVNYFLGRLANKGKLTLHVEKYT